VKLLTTNRVFFSFIVSGRLFREKWPAFFCYISPRKKKKKKKMKRPLGAASQAYTSLMQNEATHWVDDADIKNIIQGQYI
jgi:hypothetical protein